MTTLESTYLVWYCRACKKSCRTQPRTETACRCANPVRGMHPTKVTQTHEPEPRRLHALTDEEGRLRSLARKKQRVRVTYEAEVSEAWLVRGAGDKKRIQFIVTTADGSRHHVDPRLPGVRMEAIPATEEETS
ncbi:hypothetical protein PV334_20140 [Streptomyces sp. ME02-7008A-1]|uniref:hypothetical protein n=1 Tax=unclassified Streptomyces TaxID=2593676 RepID=UPI00299FB47D|nr:MULTISPECIES: hypothetical protein [unclassified Streptomyces]MDX3183560.1 hypothetical protein [Streptomyces sp. ME02-7008A-1]MDX3304012.1 hypothetical protein [Streptomyces sp. ME02-7008A]